PRQAVQQGALAGTGRPHDRGEGAPFEGRGHSVQGADGGGALPVGLGQSDRPHRRGPVAACPVRPVAAGSGRGPLHALLRLPQLVKQGERGRAARRTTTAPPSQAGGSGPVTGGGGRNRVEEVRPSTVELLLLCRLPAPCLNA